MVEPRLFGVLGQLKNQEWKNRGAKLANPEHVEILKQGVEVWNDRIIY